MRGYVLAVAGLAVLLVVPWNLGPPPGSVGLVPPSTAVPDHGVPHAHPAQPTRIEGGLALRNLTVAPGQWTGSPLAAPGVPDSAIAENPPPALPSTTPTTFTLLTDSRATNQLFPIAPPAGPFATIVLNYTGRIVNSVYDSSYRVYIGQDEVLFGVSPEYGTWTVLQNLSEYQSLFTGPTNLTFLLGAVPTTGYFLTNLSLSFYPVPTGGHAPSAPTQVIPVFYRKLVTTSGQTVYGNASVPANASAAALEVFTNGFTTSGANGEEFWWSSTHPYRMMTFGVTNAPGGPGTTLGAVLPFPHINTGGIDLFLWRPVTADFTTNHPPYVVNLTGALGWIEGNHTWWANFSSFLPNSDWIISASLLVWTNSSILSAAPGASSFSVTEPPSGLSGRFTASSSSNLSTPGGEIPVSSVENGTFQAVVAATGAWANLSESTSIAQSTTSTNGSVVTTDRHTYAFPIAVDLGSTYVQTSGTSGGYPQAGNFTVSMLNTYQAWDELRSISSTGPGGAHLIARTTVDDRLVGASGVFGGTESFSSPGVGQITSYTFDTSSTDKEYVATSGPPASPWTYAHLLIAAGYQAPQPYVAETVITDSVRLTPLPLTAGLSASVPAIDAGGTVGLSAVVAGGVGPYTYVWSGLPPGCSGGNSSFVPCTPASSGTYSVGVQVSDGLGDVVTAPTLPIVVAGQLGALLTPDNQSLDVGGNEGVNALVTGGLPPYGCAWYVDEVLARSVGNCSGRFLLSATAPGRLNVSVRITDGTGAGAWGTNLTIPVGGALQVELAAPPSGSTVFVDNATVFTASVVGGSAPFTFLWTVNGNPEPGSAGTNFTYAASAPGTYTIAVRVTDGAGASSMSNSISLTAQSPPSGGSPSSSSTGVPTWYPVLALAAIAVAIAELVALFLVLRRRAPVPAPRPPAQRSAPPKKS